MSKTIPINFTRERHNPITLIKFFWPDADSSHITYKPDMTKGDYEIINGCGHDGTRFFTHQMMQKSLVRLLNMQTHFKCKPPTDWKKVKAIKYTIGPMKHAAVFGRILLRCSKKNKYLGMKERIRIPVKCEFVYE